MEFLRGFFSILSAEMKEPTSYGWFHLMFVAIMIGVTVFLCIKFKNASDKSFRIIVAICWTIMFAFELYKQLEYSYNLTTPTITWDYQWYAFPYQLCSTPLYVLPIIFISKDSKWRDALIAYIATFSMFGGLATFIYPEQVFISTIGINIQTMVHHGLQIVLGIFFIVWARKKVNRWFYIKAIPVFAVLVTIAIIMNSGFMSLGIDETFNMFYISPYFDCTLPILSMIYPKVNYLIFVALYIFGFTFIAFLIYIIARGIIKLTRRKKKLAC